MRAWQLIAENKIQQAIEEGEFDHLPGFGKPLACLDEPFSHAQWLRDKARREELSVLPPALQLRVDVAKRHQEILQLTSERDVQAAVEELNRWIEQQNKNILWGPPSTTWPLDSQTLLTQWREARIAKTSDSGETQVPSSN